MTVREYISCLDVLSEQTKNTLREGFKKELDQELTDELSDWIEDKVTDLVQDCLLTNLEY